MPTVTNVRRYYLGKRRWARELGDSSLEVVWQAKQEAEPGTPLATTFPHRADLVALGYSTTEDLAGADARELQDAGLSKRQATDIIGALS